MDQRLELIESFRNPIEANFLKALLEENGVRAEITRPKVAGSMARLTLAYAVSVAAADAERARALLADLEARAAADPGDDDAADDAEAPPTGPRHEARWLRWLLGLGPRRD
jgi:hypothetical protein